jgi:hypothetical protein
MEQVIKVRNLGVYLCQLGIYLGKAYLYSLAKSCYLLAKGHHLLSNSAMVRGLSIPSGLSQ